VAATCRLDGVVDREDERTVLGLRDAHLAAQLVPRRIFRAEVAPVWTSRHPVVVPQRRAQLVLREVMHGRRYRGLLLDLTLEPGGVPDYVTDPDGRVLEFWTWDVANHLKELGEDGVLLR
jgi:hypothetical protein